MNVAPAGALEVGASPGGDPALGRVPAAAAGPVFASGCLPVPGQVHGPVTGRQPRLSAAWVGRDGVMVADAAELLSTSTAPAPPGWWTPGPAPAEGDGPAGLGVLSGLRWVADQSGGPCPLVLAYDGVVPVGVARVHRPRTAPPVPAAVVVDVLAAAATGDVSPVAHTAAVRAVARRLSRAGLPTADAAACSCPVPVSPTGP